MFFDILDDGWGGLIYVPNERGEALLTIAMALLLLLAMVFVQLRGAVVTARKLAFCTVAIGAAAFLSSISLFSLPTGGTITLLSMLIIALPGYFYGPGTGIMTGIAYGLFQLIIDPYIVSLPQVMVDYVLAFGIMGVSGFFEKSKYPLRTGYIAAICGRFFFSVISGWIFFGDYAWEGWNPFLYSLCYNAIYIFSEGLLTLVILSVPILRKVFEGLKITANIVELRIVESNSQ